MVHGCIAARGNATAGYNVDAVFGGGVVGGLPCERRNVCHSDGQTLFTHFMWGREFDNSVLTLGEIRKGVELRPADARKAALQEWLDIQLPRFFRGRVLGIDAATAERWGRVTASAGRPVPSVDGLLAATALQHDLVLVTRNVRDFADLGVRLLNPWDDHS